jgi:geranylgeranyl diphosphate synthase type I
MFQEEEQIGKSPLTDLKEAKKTILIWYSYRNSNTKDKKRIEKLLAKEKANRKDLLIMRGLIRKTGALDYAKREIAKFLTKATKIILSSKMKTPYKITFGAYAKEILQISNIN